MIKCRGRQATDPQKLKQLSMVVFSFFVGGSGSDRCGSRSGIGSGQKIAASTSQIQPAEPIFTSPGPLMGTLSATRAEPVSQRR